MNIFALWPNLNPKLNTYYSLSPIDVQVTQISPPHQTFVIPSRAQMGAQVITYILLITKHFVIQSGSEWVHERVNFLPSLNSQKKSSIGRMQNSQTHFFQTKQSTIEYTLNTNWVINQTLTSPWLFSYEPLSDDGHM
jgi:hypothetical protein